MKRMKVIEVSKPKRELSACLKLVRNGEVAIVLENGMPIAKIVPYRAD